MMGEARTRFLDLVKACDSFPYNATARQRYYELHLPGDDYPHGYLLPETVEKMPWTADFHICHHHPRKVTVLDSSAGAHAADAVNEAFARLVTICVDQNLFHVLDGRHSEPFAILGARLPVSVERFASSLFGITACGAHMVAYTNTDAGMKIWIGRRAKHLYSYPGYLDTTVGGGIKAGHSPFETILAEAMEEASLPKAFVRKHARACGVIILMTMTDKSWPGEKGLVIPDVLYCHEIELPTDMIPQPEDEEVDHFLCLSIAEVQDAMLSRRFKPDCALVLIDFFIRHGILTADNEEDYVEITTRLHRKLPFPITKARYS